MATINEHLKNLFANNEIDKRATIRKFLIVQKEGNRIVSREIEHYSLEVIICLGHKINSQKASEFRRWATGVPRSFTIKGYVLDNERLKNGAYLSPRYFKDLKNIVLFKTGFMNLILIKQLKICWNKSGWQFLITK